MDAFCATVADYGYNLLAAGIVNGFRTMRGV
jgi:hypothetical protein